MDKLNLTDYERGFLVAKSQEMVVNAWQLMHGDDWYSVTVVYPMGNVKQNKEFEKQGLFGTDYYIKRVEELEAKVKRLEAKLKLKGKGQS